MFIKDKMAQEGYIHVCDGISEKQMKKKGIEILLHDISTHVFLKNEKGKLDMEHIKFCPYCGCDLQKDAFENEKSEC
ncbi:hypothetical protein CN918_29280 [Priestia megaterium]|nr:hypothetical protein CN918_29280 [Priestia megaterium]